MAVTSILTVVAIATGRQCGQRFRYVSTSCSACAWLTPAISNLIEMLAKRFGSSAVLTPSIGRAGASSCSTALAPYSSRVALAYSR